MQRGGTSAGSGDAMNTIFISDAALARRFAFEFHRFACRFQRVCMSQSTRFSSHPNLLPSHHTARNWRYGTRATSRFRPPCAGASLTGRATRLIEGRSVIEPRTAPILPPGKMCLERLANIDCRCRCKTSI